MLNYPYSDCETPGKICIASVQQKKLSNSIGTNLRNIKPYKTIPLYFGMTTVRKRPFVYLSKCVKLKLHSMKFRSANIFKVLFLDIINSVEIPTINDIAYAPSPVPGLIQDDSHVRYCNADQLPEKYDVAPNGQIIYHCPHLIPLKLDKVYEIILLDNTTSTTISHPIHLHGDPL